MRWDGLTTSEDGDEQGELLAAGSIPGLVRSVTTPEFARMTFHEVRARSVLNAVPAGSAMPFRWTVNPYRGCSHACVYCYARGSHAWLDLDTGAGFDQEIVVKVNAAERVAAEVSRPAWGREHVALGTNTDPYQRAEGRYRLMPGIIEALRGSGTPFSVLTKGTLLRRDLPLLTAAARDVPVGLGVSVAVWDEALHRAIEPGAPSPRARLDLVSAVREAGLPCGVFMAPVLPGLTDSAEQLDVALAALADAGATGVTVLPLHLRPGAREWWLTWLARERPDLLPLYRELYGRGAYVPRAYRDALAARVTPLLERHGLTGRRGGEQRGVRPDEGDFPLGSLPDGTAPRARPASAPVDGGTVQLSLL